MNILASSEDVHILCLRFTLTATQHFVLPPEKGSTFHGGFGHALLRIGPRYRDFFFAPSAKAQQTNRQTLPKPFMLIPPLEEQTVYVPGESIQFGLILFGKAINQYMIVFAAIECLGRELGLGKDNGRFEIMQVETLDTEGTHPLFIDNDWQGSPQPMSAQQIVNAGHFTAQQLVLSFYTQLRLKHDNLLVRRPPAFAVFFDRLLGRVNSLSALYGDGMLVPFAERRRLLQLADTIRLDAARSTARWVDWERPAKAGREAMSFGGLRGDLAYQGDLTPFIPWLLLGQWMGVGGKTSFGLGLYSVHIQGEEQQYEYEK